MGEQLGKKGSVLIDSNFIDDLDADSLDTIELMMSLEEEFGVSRRRVCYSGERVGGGRVIRWRVWVSNSCFLGRRPLEWAAVFRENNGGC